MRELVIIFASLVLIFLLNIMLFIVSPYYKEKILTLKYWFLPEKTQNINEVSEPEVVKKDENTENNKPIETKKPIKSEEIGVINETINIENQEDAWEKPNLDLPKIYLPNSVESDFLNKFDTFFLSKQEKYTPLLWLFRDYPVKYWLFSSSSLEIYTFWENQYDYVLNYLKEKQNQAFWEVNEVNNFWDKSFYFNKIEWKVSLFLEKDSHTYGIFVDAKDYEIIKNILLQ